MSEKPLFIPLRSEWFFAFADGSKDTEYRAYGPRWNEGTCRIGREAILSHGYSGKRIYRKVAGFEKIPLSLASAGAQEIFPKAEFIAAIHLPRLDGQSGQTPPFCT